VALQLMMAAVPLAPSLAHADASVRVPDNKPDRAPVARGHHGGGFKRAPQPPTFIVDQPMVTAGVPPRKGS
jgi:hypothetical protein